MTMAGFEQIPALVDAYYDGMYAGDGDGLRRVFDPSARVRGFFADRYLDSDLEAFIAAMVSSPSAKSLGESRQLQILEIRDDGNLATAIVRDTLHGMTFTDHLSLVRGADGWRVVGKTYATPSPLPARS
jgi:hypothetical protein